MLTAKMLIMLFWTLDTLVMSQSLPRKMASAVMSQIICIPFLRRPFQDLTRPDKYGLLKVVNIRIPVKSDQQNDGEIPTLGAWLLQPASTEEYEAVEAGQIGRELNAEENLGDEEKNGFFCSGPEDAEISPRHRQLRPPRVAPGSTLVIYAHGNAETRSQYHRTELYKLYQDLGYHVLAFDYRGYGDSSSLMPNEETMTADAVAVVEFVHQELLGQSNVARLMVHGHSLGTGVAARMAAQLEGQDYAPSLYILEAPFNRMLDEVRTFRVATLASRLLDLELLLRDAKCEFDTQQWLREAKTKRFLILHAEDDKTIPYHLALQLYESLRDVLDVSMVTFPAELEYGHCNIYLDPNLPETIRRFVDESSRGAF